MYSFSRKFGDISERERSYFNNSHPYRCTHDASAYLSFLAYPSLDFFSSFSFFPVFFQTPPFLPRLSLFSPGNL